MTLRTPVTWTANSAYGSKEGSSGPDARLGILSRAAYPIANLAGVHGECPRRNDPVQIKVHRNWPDSGGTGPAWLRVAAPTW